MGRHRYLFILLCLAASRTVEVAAAAAAGPLYSTAPIAQIEVGGHSEEVRSVSVSPDGQLLLTTSVDKTARLWRAQTGQLERIIRLPIDTGEDNFRAHEGKLYASALTPDGRWAILAGYTRSSYTDPQPFMMYGVDLQSIAGGAATMRYGGIGGLPTAGQTLALSPDGHWLAACLTGAAGSVVFDWTSILRGHPQLIRQETLSADDGCYGIDFSKSGVLAISTRLGQVRIYRDVGHYNQAEKLTPEAIARPKHLRFSPDGAWLAFGSESTPVIGIMQSKAPYRVVLRQMPAEDGLRGTFAVDWSNDGSALWVGGERTASLEGVLYRIDAGGQGNIRRVLTSERRIDDIRHLPNGGVAFVSAEPEVGVVDATGRPRWLKRANTITVSPEQGDLRVNADGSEVAFRPSPYATRWLTFNAAAAPAAALGSLAPEEVKLLPPRRESPTWHFRISPTREQLWINEESVPLLPEERVLDHVVPADDSVAYIGTAWFIRKVDRAGHTLWQAPIASESEALALSADGQWLVAALTDGTLRWLRTSDGAEVLSLLALRNGIDWVAWIPAGYYESSPAGDNLFGWHLNSPRGPAQYDVRFYRAVQFDRVFYRPDLVHAYFTSQGRDSGAQPRSGFDIAQLTSIAPPQLTVSAQPAGAGQLQVHVQGTSLRARALDWNLFVDGIPVVPGADQALTSAEQQAGHFDREVAVTASQSSLLLRAESRTAQALGVEETTVQAQVTSHPPQGRLFIVAAGVSTFRDKKIPAVPFADKDAQSVADTFRALGQPEFSEVRSLVLTDSSGHAPTRATLGQIQEFLRPARGPDTIIVFLASHGLSNPRGDYFFVPEDASRQDIDAVLAGRADSGQTLVPWTTFFATLEHTAGHRILIVDTCSSSAIQGTFDAHSLEKLSLSSSFALLAASKGSEESQSAPQHDHGLFTYALLEALRTGYDPNRDGSVSVAEAFEYAFDYVQKSRNRAVGPQTPQFVAPDVLKDWPLAAVRPAVAQVANGGSR